MKTCNGACVGVVLETEWSNTLQELSTGLDTLQSSLSILWGLVPGPPVAIKILSFKSLIKCRHVDSLSAVSSSKDMEGWVEYVLLEWLSYQKGESKGISFELILSRRTYVLLAALSTCSLEVSFSYKMTHFVTHAKFVVLVAIGLLFGAQMAGWAFSRP